jgi:hypothetical protein
MSQPDHAAIQAFARQLWEQAGCPEGRDLEMWLTAESEVGGIEIGPRRMVRNRHGSITGPYNTVGGWGLPAAPWNICPRCKSPRFRYVPGFAEAATNECPDCSYSEFFRH